MMIGCESVYQPLISVIVPAYNAEKWIEGCCRSVFAQSYPEWELIVVNDGSTDSTGQILGELAGENPRLRLVSTENRGVSHARNSGLDAAKGECITFLDADDMLIEDALEKMWQLMQETKSQIVIMAKKNIGASDPPIGETEIWTDRQVLEKALDDHPASHSVYAKMYCRELVGDVRFIERRRVHEDAFFVFQCFAKCKRAAYRKEVVYLYATIAGSASNGAFSDKFYDILYFAEEKVRILQSQFPQYADRIAAIRMRANLSLLYNLCKTYDLRYRGRQRECIGYVRKHCHTFIPVTRLEKRLVRLIRFRFFWMYKMYLYVKLRKNF